MKLEMPAKVLAVFLLRGLFSCGIAAGGGVMRARLPVLL